ncbi:extracellular solute-binding protein [Streptomyces sp. 8N706]|uniref:extracellular solute-binding protein n=1 Tax=Streptomyces sp. 8N706 TaxID=3457416 RepID=UPI003FD336A0
MTFRAKVVSAVQRRFLGLMAAGVTMAMALTLSGCGADSSIGGDVTIKLVAADYGDKAANSSEEYWAELARAFEAKNPGISIDVEVYSWNDVDRKVAEMVERGEAPDIAQIGAYADYAAQGLLYRADQLLSIPTQADFLPALAKAGEVHRVQYGLPFVSSTRVLFYNKALFAKAGITSPPRTWSELEQDAGALKRAGVTSPYGLPLGAEEAQAETLNWMLSGGGGYADNIGNYTIDSRANIATFTWLRDEMVAKGLTNPKPGRTDRQEVFDSFTRGDVAMLNGHPTLMKQAEARHVKYGMAPLPGKDGESPATTGVSDWMMAFKRNGHREQVGTFLDFVYDEDNVLKFTDRYDLLPVTTSASEAMRADEDNKNLWEFLDQLPNAEFYPVNKRSWGPVVKRLKKSIGTVVEKNGDPASVLGELQRDADTTENATE